MLTFWYSLAFSRSMPDWRTLGNTYKTVEEVNRYYQVNHPGDDDIYHRLYQVEVDPLAHEYWTTVTECDPSGKPLPGRSHPLPTPQQVAV